jgi:putative ABC transport system permease protein
MLNIHFIGRQITRSGKQTTVFVLCVVLSMVTLVAVNSLRESVNDSLLKDARTLHGGDIIIHSHYEFSSPLMQTVSSLEADGAIRSTRIYELYSVARTAGESGSLLVKLKAVGEDYPFYGAVQMLSGRPFHQVLAPGAIVVEKTLLDRLSLRVGDPLKIGEATLTIRDVVVHEPDRPVDFFSLGPRVFVSLEDLPALDLVKKGSRIQHLLLVKVTDGGDMDRIAAELSRSAHKEQERVDTFRTARSGIKRFFDNFLFFLSLIAIFTLLLAGLAIRSTITAFLREKETTIAVMKTVGATSRFVAGQYLVVLGVLGALGTLLGMAVGYGLLQYLPRLFAGLLPPKVAPVLSWNGVLQGIALGTLVVAMFAFLPLYRLRDLKPSAIFRKEESARVKGASDYLLSMVVLLFFTIMVLWQVKDLGTGLYFVGGVSALIAVSAAAAHLFLSLLKKTRVKSLTLRQALRGLFRPRNATRAVIVTLAASLSVIFSITLMEQNLNAAFVKSYPADAPNVFFIDIQPSQRNDFDRALGAQAEYYPVVRARISSINGQPIDRNEKEPRRGDRLTREFNLTYRDRLLADESIIRGKSLFVAEWGRNQVSVLDTVLEMADLHIGDTVLFNIQGIPLEAKVSSIRTRTEGLIQPFFYFVFPEETLKNAPQTIFTAVRLAKERIGPLQNEIVARFPNVSVIDVTETITVFAGVMDKLSTITRFFALFSIAAGMLIIVSSILATRLARIQEAVYFSILGAKRSFTVTVFALENAILGLVSGFLGLLLSQIGSYLASTRFFDIPYKPFLWQSMLMVSGTTLLVVLVGFLSSISVLSKKPAVYLREQADG